MQNKKLDILTNKKTIKLLPEPRTNLPERNYIYFELTNQNGVQLSEYSYYANVVMGHKYIYTANSAEHTDIYKLGNSTIVNIPVEADKLLKETPEASTITFYLVKIGVNEQGNPESTNILSGTKRKNEENFAILFDSLARSPKIPIDTLINFIYPRLEGFGVRYFRTLDLLKENRLDNETKEFLELFSISINRRIDKYIASCLISEEKEMFKLYNEDIPEIENDNAPTQILQELSINPTLLRAHESPLNNELLKLRLDDFNKHSLPGYETARREYQGKYYSGKGKVKKPKPTNNALEIHKPEESTNLADFTKIKEYVEIDERELNNLVNSQTTVFTEEDIETYNGISTCVLYYMHVNPNRTFKDHCEIPLTYDDIAKGMGYKKATPALMKQIVIALGKFDKIRIENNWKEEAEARGIDINKAVDMYGQTVLYNKIPKLLNFDPAFICTEKSQNTRRNKDGELITYKGKPGIVLNQFPPLTVYHELTDQTITYPVEWLDIPKTGTSRELKRIKRYLVKRLKQALHFMDIELTKSPKNKQDYNPNHGNKNKIVLDDLLTNIGGYDLKPYELGEMITVKDKKTNEVISRPAELQDVRKRNNSIGVIRRRAVNYTLTFLDKLKEKEPRLKKIKVEDKDGRENSQEYAIRLIVG